MNFDLKMTGFPFFKVIFSAVYFFIATIFPMAWFVAIISIFFSKIHTLGAFMAMWRAKRLTPLYVFWMCFLLVTISYLGVNVLSVYILSFIAFGLFTFHYVYDEYELQEENRTFENIILMLGPLTTMYLVLFVEYFSIKIDFLFYVLLAVFFLILELIYVRNINWIFLSSKVLILFLLGAIFFGRDYNYIYYHVLTIHYFFWLAFPIYKINKYAPQDRDDFILMFLLLIFMSAFVYSTSIWPNGADAPKEILLRAFCIATIVHILSTAPFGYFFGLKRKVYEIQK